MKLIYTKIILKEMNLSLKLKIKYILSPKTDKIMKSF